MFSGTVNTVLQPVIDTVQWPLFTFPHNASPITEWASISRPPANREQVDCVYIYGIQTSKWYGFLNTTCTYPLPLGNMQYEKSRTEKAVHRYHHNRRNCLDGIWPYLGMHVFVSSAHHVRTLDLSTTTTSICRAQTRTLMNWDSKHGKAS